MSVWIYSQDFYINRTSKSVADDIIVVAGRYVDRCISFESHKHRKLGLGFIREIEGNDGIDGFAFAGRAQVNAENEIHAGIRAPRNALRFDIRCAPRLPG